MNTHEFLGGIWPRQGFCCLLAQTGAKLRHYWGSDQVELIDRIPGLEAAGATIYHACSSFATRENRKAQNAIYARSVWVDVDVADGDDVKYHTKADAARGLARFLSDAKLPAPWVIDSGGGLHCYWVFPDDVEIARVKVVARTVKRLAIHHGFRIDPMRTADMASVLRPVGTQNRKYDPVRLVEAKMTGEPYPFAEFVGAVEKASVVLVGGMSGESTKKPKASLNAAFMVQQDYPPSDANLVADRCAQMGAFRNQRGAVSEPVWYAGLEVLAHCIDGPQIAHEWSSGYAAYSAEETDKKLGQVKDYGPTTCEIFAARHPAGCAACPHKGKITSPIQLGIKLVELPPLKLDSHVLAPATGAEVDDEEPATLPIPEGFARSETGVWFDDGGGLQPCYEYDMYVEEIAFDEAAGYEVCMIKHHLPQEGWLTFGFRSSVVASEKDFETAMRDHHIKPTNTKLLRAYVRGSMAIVQAVRKMRRLYSAMGWKDGTNFFVLGDKAYFANGRIEQVGVSPSIKAVADGIHSQGSLEAWSEATELFDKPGMQAHALMFAAGAGAPLMKFTGYEGAVFNAVGLSNAGKTSMARFFMSIYGDFAKLKLKQRDTENAKIQRIGTLCSLPVYVDEITNEDPKAVSDFIYEITQGRSKLRLRVDGTERPTQEWSTIVVSSANTPLAGKLAVAKSNPEAERLRLFEFRIGREASFDDATATQLYRTCSENFGYAGERYIQYIVTHQDEVRAGLDGLIAVLKQQTHAKPEERMWMASLGCAIYGLKIMRDLNLLRFDVAAVAKWVVAQVKASRADVEQGKSDPIDLLGEYLNENAATRITVRLQGKKGADEADYLVERFPQHEVQMRYDVTEQRLWVSQRHFSAWLVERYDSPSEAYEFLFAAGVLLGQVRKVLGMGTTLATTQVRCLEIDLKHPALGNHRVSLVRGDMMTRALDQTVVPIRKSV